MLLYALNTDCIFILVITKSTEMNARLEEDSIEMINFYLAKK